jgi:diguanylate cyclase (GGDEF)-like protein/PAS domain S-box-containing protein
LNFSIVILTGLFILLTLHNALLERLQKELQKRGIFMAQHLARIVVDDLRRENYLNLKPQLYDYKKTDNDIVYIFIKNNKGEVIAHTFKQGLPAELKDIESTRAKESRHIVTYKTEEGDINVYDISVPILNGQLGVIHLGLAEKSITESASAITRKVLEIILFILFVSAAVSLYFSMKIIRPLKALEQASQELAKGNLKYRVDIKTSDEIGLLAKNFNSMAENIEEMHRELTESYRELEEEVKERKAIQAELDRSIRFLNNIYDSIIDPFVILDRNFKIIRANNAYASLKNRTVEELINKTCYRVLEGRDSVCDGCVIEKTLRLGDSCVKEKMVTRPDGTEAWLELYTYPIYDQNNQITHVIEYTRDITDKKSVEEQRKRMIEELERISRTDSLTGLFNRRALLELLEYNLKRSQRYKTRLSVILTDIDRFKFINDNYGHPIGDEIIRRVGRLIKDTLRASDIMGRYGGDEFLLILSDTGLDGAMELAERIRRVVEKTDFVINENLVLRITISLGVIDCTYMTDVDEIIRLVDDALYASKKAGRNRSYTISVS